MYELEKSTTNLSFTFYPKIKILNLQTQTQVFLKIFSWKSSSLSWLDPNLIHELDFSLSIWCDFKARAFESTCDSFKTCLQIFCWSWTPTKILIEYLKLNKHKIISTITLWVNQHQNKSDGPLSQQSPSFLWWQNSWSYICMD